jgi:hypothetical protein
MAYQQYKVYQKNSGEPVMEPLFYGLAWEEFPELQLQSKDDYVSNTLEYIKSLPRTEIYYLRHGRIVGGIITTLEHDVHVGECLSVITQYILPDYRFNGISWSFMRMIRNRCKKEGVPVMAWTHRTGDYEYKTTYRRMK